MCASTVRLRSVLRGVALGVRFGAVFTVLCLASLVLPSDVWAAPSPAPTPTAPNAVPGSWSCDDRTADPSASPAPIVGGSDCSVTDWRYPPAPSPSTADVTITGPSPLPVHEVSPPASSAPVSLCGSPASPSTSPTATASPSPSPMDSPSPASSATPCAVQVTDAQVAPFAWMGGTLVMLALAGFIFYFGRRLRRVGGS